MGGRSPSKTQVNAEVADMADMLEWQKVINKSRAQVDHVPREWVTAVQLADELGKGTDRLRQKLQAAAKAGEIEMKKFRINRNGTIRPVMHFRLTGKGLKL